MLHFGARVLVRQRPSLQPRGRRKTWVHARQSIDRVVFVQLAVKKWLDEIVKRPLPTATGAEGQWRP